MAPPKPKAGLSSVIDTGLGVALILLIAVLFRHAYMVRSDSPELMPMFIGSALLTMAGIVVTRYVSGWIGLLISVRWRSSPSIPEDCRNPLRDKVMMKKWMDQAWQLVIHFSMTMWEIRLIQQNPQWWADPSSIGCPGTYEASKELYAFAMLQCALWIVTGISCKWFEERRRDYLEMMAHHIITVALILTAIINGELGFLLVVLTVHDSSDVVLDTMKMVNYLKLEDAHGFFITEIFFVLNTYVSWPFLRLYVYPFYIIHGQYIGYQAQCMSPGWAPTWNVVHLVQNGGLWIVIRTSGLALLQLLHLFWWYILNMIGLKILLGSKAGKAGDEEYEVVGRAKAGKGEKSK